MEKDEFNVNVEPQEISDLPKNTEPSTKKKRKKSSGFKILLIIIAILCVLAVITTAAGVIYVKKNFNYKYNEITSEPEELGFEEVKEEKIVNIALFGIDTQTPNSFKGRSDSIMILSIDKTKKKIKLISVLRDSFVPMEGNSQLTFAKINNAYASGGPERAIKTLNGVFALDISEYATVNFYGMADIIDGMGGVEVPVTQAEVYRINLGVDEQCRKLGLNPKDYHISKSGTQRLNGIQAVSYSRIRYVANAQGVTNDYGRTDRQRYVLSQLFNSVASKSKSEYITLIKALSPHCETSLSYSEILELAVDVLIEKPTLEETRVPFTDYTMKAPKTNYGAINYYDLNFAANIIHAFIYEDVKPEDFIALNGVEKNDWYSTGYTSPKIVSHEERQKEKQQQQELQESSEVVSESTSSVQ